MRREGSAPPGVLLPAFLVGVAAGGLAVLAGGLLLYTRDGLLGALTVVVGVALVAVAAGVWAGPVGDPPRLVEIVRRRWLSLVVAFTAAAAFSAAWLLAEDLPGSPLGQALGAALLLAWPAYAATALVVALAEPPGTGIEDDGATRPRVPAAALLGAAVGVVVAGYWVMPTIPATTALVGSVVLLSGAALLHGRALGRRPARPGVLREATPLGTVEVEDRLVDGDVCRLLRVDGRLLGGEVRPGGSPVLGRHRAFLAWLEGGGGGSGPFLFAGGGAYTLPRLVRERAPAAPVTVVERNPAVTRAAHGYFAVEGVSGIRTLHGAALPRVRRLEERQRAIWVEGVEGRELELLSVEGIRELAARLDDGGTLLVGWRTRRHEPPGTRLRSLARTVEEVFPDVGVYVGDREGKEPGAAGELLLVARTGGGTPAEGAPAPHPGVLGPLRLLPRDSWPVGGETVTYREVVEEGGDETGGPEVG